MMRLYHSKTSPFVRKVEVVLHETGLIAETTLVATSGTPVDPGTSPVALNPLGKIPCLERPDGPALYDSRVICRYLDAKAGGRLYPAAPRLWDALTLEATADGIMEAAVLMVYETRVRPEERRHAPWVEGQWLKITRSLGALEERWMPYLAGPFDAAQVAVGCALGYLDFRHGGRDWRAGKPALAAWEAQVRERPSMRTTIPTA